VQSIATVGWANCHHNVGKQRRTRVIGSVPGSSFMGKFRSRIWAAEGAATVLERWPNELRQVRRLFNER
jgi:hypothetical protein